MTATKLAEKSDKVEDRKVHPVKPDKVKPGDVMALVYFVKVVNVSEISGNRLIVADVDNENVFEVNGAPLVERSFSADQFEEEIKVTKTKAAEILISSPNRPLTVCFEKQDGSERVLRGRLISHEALLGRSMVEDLDQDGKDRLRLVDHRTIRFLVVDGIKFVVKK